MLGGVSKRGWNMTRIGKLAIATFATLAALTLLSAASASAATVWQEDGANVTSSTNVTISGTPTFVHTGGTVGSLSIRCSVSAGGSVNASGKGTITSWSSGSCTTAGSCASPNVQAVNLSWSTQLSGGYNITNAGNNPGFSMQCSGFVRVTCTGNFSSAVSNGANVVQLTFASPTLPCSDGGTLTIQGNLQVSISGHALQVA
jgi:hypothetical protein